ncbi:MAG: hypothetical protein JXR69_03100 [Candidatus Delongbacteria bacterium]|nr:hypothetical protein [Candidatus Delongbacteria bacterium]
MDFNKVFKLNTERYHINDTEYRKLIEKSLRKLAKVLMYDSFLGYESNIPHVENFAILLDRHRKDHDKYYKSNYDKLKSVTKGFYCDKKGFTTQIEKDIFELIDQVKNLLKIESYSENNKSKEIFPKIDSKLEEFIRETQLVDKRIRRSYQESVARIRNLIEMDSYISLQSVANELKRVEKLKNDNKIKYNNVYLRNVNRYESKLDEFNRVKSFLLIKEKEVLDLQFSDIEKLLRSQSYDKFENASDILDLIEEKFDSAISDKKERIIKYLRTEVEGYAGYIWTEDHESLKVGSEKLISEAQKSKDFNDLNLDKFKVDERINLKKKVIDEFIKSLIDSSGSYRRDKKARVAGVIKQAETFYRRDISQKEFSDFVKKSNSMLAGSQSNSETVKKSGKKIPIKWILVIVMLLLSSAFYIYDANKMKEYNAVKGQEYLRHISKIAYFTRRAGGELNKFKIRKRIYVPEDDLSILVLTDSTVTIDYKGNIIKGNF